MTEPYLVRFRFDKIGKLQYISHLDLQRTMKSALIRAKVPLWYTEGFNPHPKMIFALPLSIGVESRCELMDVKINEKADPELLRAALDEQTTDEMPIKKCYIPKEKFSEIYYSEYSIVFDGDVSSCKDIFKTQCVVNKRTKSGEKDVDISPMIRRITFANNEIRAVLEANSVNFLNPDYVSSVIEQRTGKNVVSTTRLNMLKKDGKTLFC